MTALAPEITDEELLARYLAGDSEALAVAEERDRADAERKRAATAAKIRASSRDRHSTWEAAARANYDAAEVWCRGDANMLSEAGSRTGRGPWPMLWQGSRAAIEHLCSDDLIVFWDYHQPRPPSPNEYAAAEREAAAEQRARDDMPSPGMLAAIAAARGEASESPAPVAATPWPGTFVKFGAALDWITRKTETSAARIAAANGRTRG